eukprot:7876012-Pyramimonas_sp.AAC.1
MDATLAVLNMPSWKKTTQGTLLRLAIAQMSRVIRSVALSPEMALALAGVSCLAVHGSEQPRNARSAPSRDQVDVLR